ncbi:MAG: hypothetical protein DRJ66_04620 [Thermoprotei archaeon]|nr:MAG: hypothetical protein DRJ66_04620 [Thermoprotei archaeon]
MRPNNCKASYGDRYEKNRASPNIMDALREKIERAIDIYNRYRAPEAIASLISIDNKKVIIKFKGPFCVGCGISDWIEDFKYVLLEEFGMDTEIMELKEVRNEDSRWIIAIFKLLNP